MSLHASSSLNAEGSTPKDPLYKILDELRSLREVCDDQIIMREKREQERK